MQPEFQLMVVLPFSPDWLIDDSLLDIVLRFRHDILDMDMDVDIVDLPSPIWSSF